MKIKLNAIIACLAFLPIAGFAQTPPAPPPAPGHPPGPPGGHEKAPKVPAIFLGVETSQVPTVVSEQLGLSKGLGLVVEYVVPDSPAAAADRKSTRLNSSHTVISYAVFCLKKKKNGRRRQEEARDAY